MRIETRSLKQHSALIAQHSVLCAAFCAILFALSFPANAQQTGKVFRIGYLDIGSASGDAMLVEAFRHELSNFGWVAGKNVIFEYRFAEGKADRLLELAGELVRLKVDLIVATGAASARAAKEATGTIPIVMTSATDPVGAGLIASLARPGGNVTGFASLTAELNTKRLEILKDVVPKLARVGLLRLAADNIAFDLQLQGLRTAAASLRLKLEEIKTETDTGGLASSFQTANQAHVNAIMTLTTRAFFAERKQIVELAGKYRMPAIYFEKEFVDEGGLMSYGLDYFDLYRRAAVYAAKILKGAKPADLPVEQPTKFEFVVNLKTAKQIGLTIPPNVLARADKVIR